MSDRIVIGEWYGWNPRQAGIRFDLGCVELAKAYLPVDARSTAWGFYAYGLDGVRHGPVPVERESLLIDDSGLCDSTVCNGCAVRCMEEALEPEWEIFV